jgi:hypothetical protein
MAPRVPPLLYLIVSAFPQIARVPTGATIPSRITHLKNRNAF